MPRHIPRIGIALGAGSARGWAHIGVLQTLAEADIVPEVVCGTSIGALVGAVYADDRLPELEQWVRELTWRRVMGYFDFSFGSGLLKGGKLFEAANEPKAFLEMSGGHNDGFIFTRPEWVAALAAFLDSHAGERRMEPPMDADGRR